MYNVNIKMCSLLVCYLEKQLFMALYLVICTDANLDIMIDHGIVSVLLNTVFTFTKVCIDIVSWIAAMTVFTVRISSGHLFMYRVF